MLSFFNSKSNISKVKQDNSVQISDNWTNQQGLTDIQKAMMIMMVVMMMVTYGMAPLM